MTWTRPSIVFSTLMFALLALPAVAQQTTPPVIAIVDMEEVYRNLDERTAIETRHNSAMQELQTGYQQRNERIQELQLDLRMLDEGTREFRAKQEEIVEARAMARAWLEIRQQSISRDTGERIESMRNRMVEAVAALAAERGIDMVLSKNVQMAQQSSQRGQQPNIQTFPMVIWSNGKSEITQDIVSRMNTQFSGQ